MNSLNFSVNPIKYSSLDINIQSITITNPYIDIVEKKVCSVTNLNNKDSYGNINIIKSVGMIVPSSTQDETLFNSIVNLPGLYKLLESYFNLTPTMDPICTGGYIYNPDDYAL